MSILKFKNTLELLKYLDDEISKLRSEIKELESRIQDLKARVEAIKRVEDVLKELIPSYSSREQVLQVGGVRVLLNPQLGEELGELLQLKESTMTRLRVLEGVREALNPLARIGEFNIEIEVIEDGGIPRALIIRI